MVPGIHHVEPRTFHRHAVRPLQGDSLSELASTKQGPYFIRFRIVEANHRILIVRNDNPIMGIHTEMLG